MSAPGVGLPAARAPTCPWGQELERVMVWVPAAGEPRGNDQDYCPLEQPAALISVVPGG